MILLTFYRTGNGRTLYLDGRALHLRSPQWVGFRCTNRAIYNLRRPFRRQLSASVREFSALSLTNVTSQLPVAVTCFVKFLFRTNRNKDNGGKLNNYKFVSFMSGAHSNYRRELCQKTPTSILWVNPACLIFQWSYKNTVKILFALRWRNWAIFRCLFQRHENSEWVKQTFSYFITIRHPDRELLLFFWKISVERKRNLYSLKRRSRE